MTRTRLQILDGELLWVYSPSNTYLGTVKVNSSGELEINSAAAFRFQVASAEKVTILSTGFVGIGTDNPTAPLELYGSTYKQVYVHTTAADGTSTSLRLQGGGSGADWVVITNRSDLSGTAGSLGFYHSTAGPGSVGTKMVIDDSGFVGIGTTIPANTLFVFTSSSTLQ